MRSLKMVWQNPSRGAGASAGAGPKGPVSAIYINISYNYKRVDLADVDNLYVCQTFENC